MVVVSQNVGNIEPKICKKNIMLAILIKGNINSKNFFPSHGFNSKTFYFSFVH